MNFKTKMLPRTTETAQKSLRKYLSKISGKHDVKEVQKTATLGIAPIFREVPEEQNICCGKLPKYQIL
jgi:hypothetical protein